MKQGLGRHVFVVVFLLCFGAMALWSYATPLFGAPDEPVHMVKAAAVVRGEWLGNLADGPSSPFALVTVPEFYALLRWPGTVPAHSPLCFHAHPNIPASCVIPADNGVNPQAISAGATREAWIYNTRYPPLYYAIVGIPTLFGSGTDILYLMRLLSALICSAFIALAASVIARYSRSRLLYVGLFVATTPMVLFLGGVVNPSGLEIAAAICSWTTGLVLVREHLAAPPRALVWSFVFASSVLALSRSLSPLWLALIGLTLIAISDRHELARALARRDAQVALSVLGIVVAAALVWIVKEHATLVYTGATQVSSQVPPGTSTLTIVRISFEHNAFYFPDMVGVFGWFDTWAPSFTYLVWYVLGAALVFGALISSSLRRALVAIGLFAAIVIGPVLISSAQVRHDGYIWAGRDTLPLAVGLPLLCSALATRLEAKAVLGRLIGLGALAAAAAQFLAFYQALRRYTVSTRGALFAFIAHPSWHPPIEVAALLMAELLIVGLAAFSLASGYGPPWRGLASRPKPASEPSSLAQPAEVT